MVEFLKEAPALPSYKEEIEEENVPVKTETNGELEQELKMEDISLDDGEIFVEDFPANDDDDFEWKEDPVAEAQNDSAESGEGKMIIKIF